MLVCWLGPAKPEIDATLPPAIIFLTLARQFTHQQCHSQTASHQPFWCQSHQPEYTSSPAERRSTPCCSDTNYSGENPHKLNMLDVCDTVALWTITSQHSTINPLCDHYLSFIFYSVTIMKYRPISVFWFHLVLLLCWPLFLFLCYFLMRQ